MHEFAFYTEFLTPHYFTKPALLSVSGEHLFHRLVEIIRIRKGDSLILFDQEVHVRAIFDVGSRKSMSFEQCVWTENKPAKPAINFLLPLLKKNDLEEAVYNLTEMGVTTIQLVTTDSTHKSWWSEQKDYERLMRIIIAAAEQSKNFSFPELLPPRELSDVVSKLKNQKQQRYFFDPAGMPITALIQQANALPNSGEILALVGPEADVTVREKEWLKNNNFTFYALTPTVLRAYQAATLVAGMLRSLIR
jgi:RsmE family RNA methyltransferase